MPENSPSEDVVHRLSDAIASAEGWYDPKSLPRRNNNPGNLTLDTNGRGLGKQSGFVRYASAADGLDALQTQVRKMFDGSSAIYHPLMTIRDVANRYTQTDPEIWAKNVSTKLGVQPDTTLSTLTQQSPAPPSPPPTTGQPWVPPGAQIRGPLSLLERAQNVGRDALSGGQSLLGMGGNP